MTILFAESNSWMKNVAFRKAYAMAVKQAYKKIGTLLLAAPEIIGFVNRVALRQTMKEYGHGVYLLDRVVKRSNKSILELTNLSTKQIISLAGIDRGPQKI